MHIDLIAVPYDSAHRGLRMGAGPQHLLAHGLAARLEQRGHHVTSSTIDPSGEWRAELATAFELAASIAERVRSSHDEGHLPLVLAGNCMAALGVVSGLGAQTRVLWFDAHGDFNTPDTTTGGFLDGMAVATITGRCWSALAARVPGFTPVREADVWLLGTRDLDAAEEAALSASAVTVVRAEDVDEGLGARVAREHGAAGELYVHLDLDVLDPADGRVNRYAADRGVRLAALREALESVGERARPAALTLSAYDPAFDADGRVCAAAFGAIESFVAGRARATESGR